MNDDMSRWLLRGLLSLCVAFTLQRPAHALIIGAAGNDPVNELAWRQGAVDVANLKSRIARWEGPPFGGGESHFEYRGDADAFNEALAAFAKIVAPKRQLIVYDGAGRSFWLNTAVGPDADARMDWTFCIWEAERFNMLFNSPSNSFLALSENYRGVVPAPEIVVYADGNIDWAKVVVPAGIDVDDRRLASRGYTLQDGPVIEVSVWQMSDLRPVVNAELVVEQIEPQKEGGYRYQILSTTEADEHGKIVLRNAPAGWVQLVVWADGFAPKIVGYGNDDQPRWSSYNVNLSPAHQEQGRVVDEKGHPVPGAQVRIDDLVGSDGRGYRTARELSATSNDHGEFTIDAVPEGFGKFRASAETYVFEGLGELQPLKGGGVTVSVVQAGKIEISVKAGKGKTPGDYLVQIAPSDGEAIGKWGGSSQVAADGTCAFTHIPPGSYTLSAHPNPGAESDRTPPVTVEIKGGETAQVTLEAE